MRQFKSSSEVDYQPLLDKAEDTRKTFRNFISILVFFAFFVGSADLIHRFAARKQNNFNMQEAEVVVGEAGELGEIPVGCGAPYNAAPTHEDNIHIVGANQLLKSLKVGDVVKWNGKPHKYKGGEGPIKAIRKREIQVDVKVKKVTKENTETEIVTEERWLGVDGKDFLILNGKGHWRDLLTVAEDELRRSYFSTVPPEGVRVTVVELNDHSGRGNQGIMVEIRPSANYNHNVIAAGHNELTVNPEYLCGPMLYTFNNVNQTPLKGKDHDRGRDKSSEEVVAEVAEMFTTMDAVHGNPPTHFTIKWKKAGGGKSTRLNFKSRQDAPAGRSSGASHTEIIFQDVLNN